MARPHAVPSPSIESDRTTVVLRGVPVLVIVDRSAPRGCRTYETVRDARTGLDVPVEVQVSWSVLMEALTGLSITVEKPPANSVIRARIESN